MKQFDFFFLLFTFLSIYVFGQKEESAYGIGLTTIAQVNQGNSYITFPTDIGNIEPLWFEGNVIPNFYLRKSKDSRLVGVLSPQIIIRMYQEASYPMRTPSYMPQITAYYLFSSKFEANSLSGFMRYAHHSNGQDGDFYIDNGAINLNSGNFSTNYLELGLIKTNYNKKYKAAQFFSTSFQIHPKSLTSDDLEGLYSLYSWNAVFSIFKLPKDSGIEDKNASISIKGKTTWMLGGYNQLEAFSIERLNLTLTFYYHPKFLEDIGLFVQYYHGSDYYNIYFDHRLNLLRFGFMTEKLRF